MIVSIGVPGGFRVSGFLRRFGLYDSIGVPGFGFREGLW